MKKIFRKEKLSPDVKYYYLFGKKIAKKKDTCFYLGNWYVGWHDWKFGIYYNVCGYEEGNGQLHISMFGWHNVFKFPWKSKRFPYGDCDAPQYGIMIHNDTFWFHYGGKGNMNGGSKYKCWDIPFFTKKHVRHEVVCDLGDNDLKLIPYNQITNKNNHYIPLRELDIVKKYHYDYVDSYDGEVCPCTYWVEEREWRPKWMTWTKMFRDVKRYIEIVFEKEVGKEKGSWKGGCIGCSYDLLPGEDPRSCIRRMELERKF